MWSQLANQRMRIGIVDILGGAAPATDEAPLIEDNAKFTDDNPAMVDLAFFANLVRTVVFAHGMYQLGC